MASSRVGLLGTRNLLSTAYTTKTTARRVAEASIGSWRARPPCTASSVRWYAVPKVKPPDWSPPSPKTQLAQANQGQISATDVAFILPGTLVAPPISQYPREPRKFLKFAYEVLVTYLRTTASGLGIVWSSKPSMFKKAQFKLNNAATLLTAKAMHRSMAEALAAGDKRTITKICTKLVGQPMLAAIDARPPKRRYTWQLVRYHDKWRNPRIASQMVAPTTANGSGPLLRQVVVSISSRQCRAEEVQKSGIWEMVPGSKKTLDVAENVVLVSIINPKTWKQSEWRILGTVPTMTPEDWYAEKEILNKLEQEEFQKKMADRID